jgi:hypothetical protein
MSPEDFDSPSRPGDQEPPAQTRREGETPEGFPLGRLASWFRRAPTAKPPIPAPELIESACGDARPDESPAEPPIRELEDQRDSASESGAPRAGGRSNPDLERIFVLFAAVLAVVADGLALSHKLPLLAATQYSTAFGAFVIWLIAVGYPPPPRSRTDAKGRSVARRRAIWLGVFFLIFVTGATQPPSVLLVTIYSAVLWLFLFSEWRCELPPARKPDSATQQLWRAAAATKRALSGRRGRRATALLAAVAALAIGGTAGATLSVLSHKEDTVSEEAPTPQPPTIPTTPTPTTPASSNQGQPGSGGTPENPKQSKSAGTCTPQSYAKAEWATGPINHLLENSGLGPEEEGCLEELKTEYLSKTGFVWSKGISNTTGRPVSIVVDSYTLGHPAIFIAPALPQVEQLIRHYELISGTEKPFPRYRAGQGDFYLVNTARFGTCVLIRSRSGESDESVSYELLYPAEAAAWARIIQVTKKWQWPERALLPDSKGEAVIKLRTSGGSETPDTEITIDKGGRAHWWQYKKDFVFETKQRDLSPTELEVDVLEYLPTDAHGR